MSYTFDDNNGGDWNSHTFPYNLSTFTASSNVHPDLPSEPPGYDEFEFSFPSELSPSLFGLPFLGEDQGSTRGILSPTGSSFPALSRASQSPAAWADPYASSARSLQTVTNATNTNANATAGPSTSTSSAMTRGHTRQDSALIAKKLFEDDERTALDEFFNKTLDEAATLSKGNEQASASSTETSVTARRGSAANALASASTSAAPPEPRKRTRRPPPIQTTASSTKPSAKTTSRTASSSKTVPSDPSPAAKQEEDDDAEFEDVKSPAKRGRTDSASVPSSVPVTGRASGSGKRSSHIASEQKRRSTIKDNYKCLVDLLLAGEATSGISLLGGGDEEDEEGGETTSKKSKPKGRGRGRKGQDFAGATKSVVLTRAADYVKWLDKGNQDLEREIGRLENILAA